MRNLITYIFIALILSCSSTNQKKKLIGNWYYCVGNKIDSQFEFYNDSLVIYDSFGWKSTLKWELDSKKIYTSYLNEAGPIFRYKLDKKNESFYFRLISNDSTEFVKAIKAKNVYDLFQKLVDLKIQLPTKETDLKQISSANNLNFNIYAGYNNDHLVVKTDLSPNLSNLEKEVNEFKENSRDELKGFLKFNLIADKNITESQLDSIKNLLKETSIKQVFRTYKNDQTDYDHYLNWFGQKE